MLLNCGAGEDSWESLGQQGDPTSPFWRKSVLNIHWKDWCWSWNSNPLVTWCKELTHWKRPWCWERLKAGERDDRGWDGWMASLTRWTWVAVSSGDGQGSLVYCSPWGRKEWGMTEWLNWTELNETAMQKNGFLLQRTTFSRSNIFHLGNSFTIRGTWLLIHPYFKESLELNSCWIINNIVNVPVEEQYIMLSFHEMWSHHFHTRKATCT